MRDDDESGEAALSSDSVDDSEDATSGTPSLVGASSLFRNTGFAFGADLIFALGRMLTFFLLGISLGPAQLGRYVAVLGLTQLIFPLSRLGISHVMVRSLTRGGDFSPAWSKVVTVHLAGGILGSGLSVGFAAILFDVSWVTTFLIGLSQLIGLGLQQAAGMAAAAYGRTEVGLIVNGLNTLLRVMAIVGFFTLVSNQTVDAWARFLVVASIAGALITLTVVHRAFGGRLRLTVPTRGDLGLAAGFVFVDSAKTAQADIDKVVLGGFGLDTDAGVYAAAYRLADLATLPLGALVRASYSEFFRRGSTTIAGAVRYARKLTGVSVAYGLCAGVALWVTAPLLGVILGQEFDDSITALRWIAFIPAIRAAQFFPANVLTGTDRQWVRARLMSVSAGVNLALNIVLVPEYGWRGAALSTIVAEAFFTISLWLTVSRALRNERQAE